MECRAQAEAPRRVISLLEVRDSRLEARRTGESREVRSSRLGARRTGASLEVRRPRLEARRTGERLESILWSSDGSPGRAGRDDRKVRLLFEKGVGEILNFCRLERVPVLQIKGLGAFLIVLVSIRNL
jgi:hypothetical protein